MKNRKRKKREERRETQEALAQGRKNHRLWLADNEAKHANKVAEQFKAVNKVRVDPFLGFCDILKGYSGSFVRVGVPKIRGKKYDTKVISAVKFHLVKYPVPRFLYNVWINEDPRKGLFIQLAQGTSPKKLIKNNLLPKMTKRQIHIFLQGPPPASCGLEEAYRYAQVISFGGSKQLWKTLTQQEFLRDNWYIGLEDMQDFWSTVIQWFCNNYGMLDMGVVGPLLDFIRGKREEDHNFSLKGRTIPSVMRLMEEWHRELGLRTYAKETSDFESSGIAKPYSKSVKMQATVDGSIINVITELWTIQEIIKPKELASEGRKMHHCVVSYDRRIRSGSCSIWTMRCNNMRQLTIELDNKSRKIAQAGGHYNRSPNKDDKNHLKRWARQNGLTLGRYF
jgi:PcfJ-like protein